MAPHPATRAEISRSRLVANFQRLRAVARRASADVVAVVKADAYGHGARLCAPRLVEAGAQWLAVTSVEEGVAVRRLCPAARVLVLSGLLPDDADAALDARLAATVWDLLHLESLARAAVERNLAAGSVAVHLEIDTGMSRQGVNFAAGEVAAVLEKLRASPALRLEGVFTHFASPEMLDAEQNAQQMARFSQAVEQIAAAGFQPEWIHAGNSSTLIGGRQTSLLASLARKIGAKFLFRPGLALYGYALPFTGGSPEAPVDLQPVLTWKTAIASLRTVEAGTRIGYGGSFVAPTKMRLALLPVGYADGLNRKLSNRGHVLVRGCAAPIVGRVSMDMTIVDASRVQGVAAGDEVVILGEQEKQRVTADDHARWAETISYEILCAVSARVPRVACD